MGNRTRKLRLAALASLLAAALGGLVMGMVALHGRDYLPLTVIGPLLAGILAVTFAATLPWWRRLDHMERDSHLTSWYWGGSFGGGLGLMLMLLVERSSGDQLVIGAVLMMFAQVAGYGIALLGWRLAHRARAS